MKTTTHPSNEVRMRDITGLSKPPVSLLNARGRMDRQTKQQYFKDACAEVAKDISIYSGKDIYVDMQSVGILIDTNERRHKFSASAPRNSKLSVTNHLVQQWLNYRNDKFAVVCIDGENVAVSLAEFVGLGLPEANPHTPKIPQGIQNQWLTKPL